MVIHKDRSGQQKTIVDYYPGAYGPTLRLDFVSRLDLAVLLGHIRALSEDNASQLNLLSGLDCDVRNVSSVVAAVTYRSRVVSVTRKMGPDGLIDVLWQQSTDGWRHTLGLLEGRIATPAAGHQYLSDESVDELLIELALGERESLR